MVTSTIEQGACETWQSHRWCSLTASNCIAVSHMQSKIRATSIMNDLMWKTEKLTTAALLYGTWCEPVDRRAYGRVQQKIMPGYKVSPSGLWVNPNMPNLAASPDGIALDSTQPSDLSLGLTEIECPHTIRNWKVYECSQKLRPEQHPAFCLKKDDRVLALILYDVGLKRLYYLLMGYPWSYNRTEPKYPYLHAPLQRTQKEMERWHRGSRWQSMDENGPGSKCMAQVVEAICQQWHERLRWWWWWHAPLISLAHTPGCCMFQPDRDTLSGPNTPSTCFPSRSIYRWHRFRSHPDKQIRTNSAAVFIQIYRANYKVTAVAAAYVTLCVSVNRITNL